MWDFRCPQLAGWAGSLLPEQPNCQGNQTAPTPTGVVHAYLTSFLGKRLSFMVEYKYTNNNSQFKSRFVDIFGGIG